MDIYAAITTVLESVGVKVYFLKPSGAPQATYVYFQRISTDKQGNFGYRIDRFRFTLVSTTETNIKALITTVENALFYNQLNFDLVEPVFQMEGTEGNNYYSKVDMKISYIE